MTKKKAPNIRKKRTFWKDIKLAWLEGRGDGVRAMKPTPPVALFRKAVEMMPGAEGEKLGAFIEKELGMTLEAGGRGRPLPVVGDRRPYKAQHTRGQGGPFLRLPLSPLVGAKKGAILDVQFLPDRIIVMKAT